MSKNVKILENGVENVLQDVAKIQTQLTNGGKCLWVPYDEYPLGVLTVTQDGVYKASEDVNGPYYGYSQVIASGVGNIVMGSLGELTVTENGTYEADKDTSGPFLGYSKVVVNVPIDDSYHTSSGTIGKDDQGDDVIATVNPDTGEIEVHKMDNWIAELIQVTEFPSPYVDGQIITTEGMSFVAYRSNDDPWGTLSNEEITISPTIAVYDESTYSEDTGGSLQSITASWPRPNDGQILQTTFSIIVVLSSSGSDDS